MQQKNKQLIVFIKAPLPGQCKTRLIPYLSAKQASEFYKTLVINCFKNISPLDKAGVKTQNNTDIAIYTWPDIDNSFIKTLASKYNTSLHLQQGNNLGERMHHAMQHSLQHYKSCVLIGSDCPGININYINQAFSTLSQHDMVLGPAQDGGYVLIGANKINPELFTGINWGSEKVLQQSLNNASAAQYKTGQLTTLWDIDTPADYIRYQSDTNINPINEQCRNNHG
jgi:uncharacterized protein